MLDVRPAASGYWSPWRWRSAWAASRFAANRDDSTLAFLISTSDLGLLYGEFEEECPQGFELTLEEGYLASLSPGPREWMRLPHNSFEYGRTWKNDFATGPAGENVCSHPTSFRNDPRRLPYRGVSSKVAYGLNLDGTTDGRATPRTCVHQKFEGLNGEPVIDNQLYRVSGCRQAQSGHGKSRPTAI